MLKDNANFSDREYINATYESIGRLFDESRCGAALRFIVMKPATGPIGSGF
jgi:hypothetical protein